FHSPPHTSERAAEKARDLAKLLASYAGRCRLYIVPFTQIQTFLYEKVQHSKLTLLLKRAMLRISNQIADKEGAGCLITGDSVGQVASQTVKGLEAVNSASRLPILRPLATMDKQQIIDVSRKIGAYPISIRPYDDCCTLFVAKHPESKPKASVIEGIESRFHELAKMYETASALSEIVDYN
ncbi:MAG: tRNA 4-thiouridine(8) synthase ThiI, partial [Defluviitaleaceae bacterium]|nr:tRNA 4-thiouridine(8) synthase ThiI [Defluviitaleaceae bacterium]